MVELLMGEMLVYHWAGYGVFCTIRAMYEVPCQTVVDFASLSHQHKKK